MLTGATLLLAVALLLRVAGSAVRGGSLWLPHPAAGWLAVAGAVWLYAGAAGTWVSPVPALFAGVVAAFADAALRRPPIRILFDPALVVLLGLLSLPALPFVRLGAAALTAAAIGFVVDRAVDAFPAKARSAAAALPLLVLLLALFLRPWIPAALYDLIDDPMMEGRLARLTLVAPPGARREVLETGAVVRIENGTDRAAGWGALLFHGADPRGSRQPAAEVLRRSLRTAGFTTVSLDAAGFGSSPAPAEGAPLSAWDPAPHSRAALARLRAVPGVEEVIVVGHSMGVWEAIRLLGEDPKIVGAALFGGTYGEGGELDDYWYDRFHRDRGLPYRLDREDVMEIGRRYSDPRKLLERLRPDHGPILFARFENEFADVKAARDTLASALPGPVETWDIEGSDHYFNAEERLGVVSGDVGVSGIVTKKLRGFRRTWGSSRAEETGEPETESGTR